MGGDFGEGADAGVIDLLTAALRVECDEFDGEGIGEISGRIVEGEMAVDADAAADDVKGSGVEFGGVVGCGLRGIVAGDEKMRGGEGEMIEDCAAQPEGETLRCVGGEADVFIHVEGGDAGPIDRGLGTEGREHFTLAGRGGENDADAGLGGESGADGVGNVRGSLRAQGVA